MSSLIKEASSAKLAALVKKGALSAEILQKELGLSPQKIKEALGQEFNGHHIFEQRLEGELFYHFFRKVEPQVLKPRMWHFQQTPDPKKPYFWIQFPDTNWRKIILVPLSDIQWGAEDCDIKQIEEYVRWIERTDNVFAFINGDLLNNSLLDSPKGAIFWDKMRPREQVRTVIKLLSPIAHKILWAIPGNHEERTIKIADIDPLYWICRTLEIPYSEQPVFADILWKGYRFNMYCFHGVSGSRTAGGKLNAAMRPTEWTQFTMFNIMGHVHEPMGNPITRRCIVREYDEHGKLKELRVVDRDQYVIICAAWLEFWGSYAAKQGYSPPSQGGTPCFLLANGGYEISE